MKTKKTDWLVWHNNGAGFLQPIRKDGIAEWGLMSTAQLFTKNEARTLAKFFGGEPKISLNYVYKIPYKEETK